MAEIKEFPELGVGDEVGIGVEYFGVDYVARILEEAPEIPPGKPAEAPTWGRIWFEVRWRLRTDWENFKEWVRSKWRRDR